METGTIKFAYGVRNYGFIGRADGDDVFFHGTAWQDDAMPEFNEQLQGILVTFDLTTDRQGRPLATNVRRVN